jgi:hypothetical protein
VLELPVLHEEREPTEMVGFRDDHSLPAPLWDDQVGADRVRVVVDLRDHPARDVLDVAAEDERRHLRQRRHHPEEGAQPAEQRQHVVRLGLLPEALRQLLHLLGMIGRDVSRLREVVGQVVELGGFVVGIPAGAEGAQLLGIEIPGDPLQALGEQPPVLYMPRLPSTS